MVATSAAQKEALEVFSRLKAEYINDPLVFQGIALAEKVLNNAGEAAWDAKTYIGVPHIHTVEWETAKGILMACSEKPHLILVNDFATSLLAWGFNHLWCDALNTRVECNDGSGLKRCKYTYWLLNHADISYRTPWFLDVLIEEMEKGGWDALHVPMAIKDERRLSSTGIGNGDDEWGRIRRITIKELAQLPPTFGLDEAVEVLKKSGHVPKNPVFCPNTGCLLIKVNEDWAWDFPGFTIMDRLQTRVDANGQLHRTPQAIPEDWGFGMWMQKAGLKVGGCRKVRTNHYCQLYYTNDLTGTGEEKDEGYLADNLHW